MALFDGVQGKWSLTEAAGASRIDTSGNSNTLTENTVSGTIANVAGHDGTVTTAASFVRANTQELKIADTASLSVTGNLSIAFWFKRDSNHNGGLVSKFDVTGNQRSYIVRIQTDDKVKFFVSTSGTAIDASINNPTIIAAGVWYFVVARYDGTNISINVNAGINASVAYTAGIFDSTSDFEIGGHNSNSGSVSFDGSLSDVVIWNRAITNAEVSELFALGDDFAIKPTINQARAQWKLSEASGTRADSNILNNDLIDNNTVTSSASGALFTAANSEFLSLTNAAQRGLDFVGDISVFAKFKLNSIGVDQAIVGRWFTAGADRAFLLRVTAANKLQFFISTDGTASASITGTTVLTAGVTYKVFTIRLGSAVDIYIDNTSDGGATIAGDMVNTISDIQMGAFNTVSNFFDGIIFDCAIWGTALTSTQRDEIRFFGEDFTPTPISLTDVENLKIIQRNGSNQGSLLISGTHDGTAISVEARIVNDGTSTEIVTWTAIDAAPFGGVFSGTLAGIPQGGWYNVQVRMGNDTGVTDNGTNKFGVGVLVVVIGQSQGTRFFDDSISPPTPNAVTSIFNTSNAWAVPTGNGAITFLNTLNSNLSLPICAVYAAEGGSALRQEAESTNGYWLNFAGAPYTTFLSRLNSAGNSVEYVFWTQGERDARSSVVTEAEYNTSLTSFFAQLRTDVSNPVSAGDIKIVSNLLGRGTDAGDIDTDFQAIRSAQESVLNSDTNVFIGATAVDLPMQDTIHYSTVGYQSLGNRIAQTILDDLGVVTFHRGARGLNYTLVNSTTIDVNIAHSGGTDFTPTTNITGFEVFDGGTPATINTADRQDANTIRLTLASAITGDVTARYLYGANPVITGIVIDNTTLTLPLEGDIDLRDRRIIFRRRL